MNKKHILLVSLGLAGLFDAAYLTIEHYRGAIPHCAQIPFVDCGKVLSSPYATQFGLPLPVAGLIYYGLLLVLAIVIAGTRARKAVYALLTTVTVGLVASAYFVFLQVAVIRAICLYCMMSALITTAFFTAAVLVFRRERYDLVLDAVAFIYQKGLKRIMFLIDPERVHTHMTQFGERLGSFPATRGMMSMALSGRYPALTQKIHGITFATPIGLAAGFDYEGQLTQILPAVGFGFQTIGTVTNLPYEGNPRPRLGRLPRSRSLMVNKGFKGPGGTAMVEKLTGLTFRIPVGISVGRSNNPSLTTQKQSIADIVKTFTTFEKSSVPNAYYELNISCPNLFGDVTFYPPANLRELLKTIDGLHLSKPVFIKMPISHTDADTRRMLDVIVDHSPVGVIIGNLQTNRNHPSLVPSEVKKFKTGNFSGKPTYERSNQLIELTYRHYGKRLAVIGCGGVFSGADAFDKICHGASLVQLITGMIFQGPQLICQINRYLEDRLKEEGIASIDKAVGLYVS